MSIKKALIIGNTNLGYSWFVKTFTQGLNMNNVAVYHIDYKSTPLNDLRWEILKIEPHYIFTHLSFHANIHPTNTIMNFFKDIKSKLPTIIVHTCQDARTKDRYMGDLRGVFDAAFVGTYPMVENCSKAFKIPVFYSPYSSLCYDVMGEWEKELAFKNPVFTGSPGAHRQGWADNRAGFIESLQKVMKIKIFKTQSAQDLRERTLELSASAKCILGLCVGYEIDGYMDVRPFQYLGAGAFMIMRKFKDMDRYIPEDLYVPFYSYNDPMIVKNLWDEWKNRNTTKMREKAFQYMQSHHSCKRRLEDVLKVLEKI
jgi:hypothetical protein